MERKGDSLPPLGFEPANFMMLAHLSDRSAKSHPRSRFLKIILESLKMQTNAKTDIQQPGPKHLSNLSSKNTVFNKQQ
jgi:hypothetical protein